MGRKSPGEQVYSDEILQHFQHPHNVGEIVGADGFGQATGGEHCPEDLAYFWIKVDGERLVEVKQKTRGCPVAIAASSVTGLLAEGKTLQEAESITTETVAALLGDMPERKLDSIVGPKALQAAVADYRAKAATNKP
jgi:nitrogen fixation NifU-like protein